MSLVQLLNKGRSDVNEVPSVEACMIFESFDLSDRLRLVCEWGAFVSRSESDATVLLDALVLALVRGSRGVCGSQKRHNST